MAQINVTFSESIRLFGGEPSNKWGTVNWNQKWGYGNLAPIMYVYTRDYESIGITEETSPQLSVLISNSLSMSDDVTNETLSDAAGYLVIIDGSSNLENRVSTSFTNQAEPSTSYSPPSHAASTWTKQ